MTPILGLTGQGGRDRVIVGVEAAQWVAADSEPTEARNSVELHRVATDLQAEVGSDRGGVWAQEAAARVVEQM